MSIRAKFNFEQTVYLKTDPEQLPSLVTGIVYRPEGYVEYFISNGAEEILVREFEIQAEKNILIGN